MERPRHRAPAADFLDGYALDVLVVLVIDIARVIERRRNLVAEPSRPGGKRRHKVPLVRDARVHFHHIAVIETERLTNGKVLIGVLEGYRGGSTLLPLHR